MSSLFFFSLQDTLDELKLVTGGTLAQARDLQDCFLQQIESAPQYTGKASNQFIQIRVQRSCGGEY